MLRTVLAAAVLTTSIVHFGHADEDLSALKAMYEAPKSIPHPADNPADKDKVALGRDLYFDPSLSSSETVACATCHDPRYGFEDGRARSLGVPGEPLPRHSPTTLNLAWGELFFWDGRAASLEEQALGPIAADKEMAMPHNMLVEKLRKNADYPAQFRAVFPDEGLTIDTIGKAIAAFERTLVSNNAPFDAWIAGDEDAISDAAKRGFAVFNGDGRCADCHSGWNFTDDGFHDIGLKSDDVGRYGILEVDALKHAFKTPGLRNIVERAPYMHTGDIYTLEEVVEHYDNGFVQRDSLSPLMQPLGLSDQQKADLVAFMKTLSAPVDQGLVREAERTEALILKNTE